MAEILVIGAGAAGMAAALFAARGGASVTVLERNEKPGKKIYITGKGRCNLTNDCDRDTFLSQVARNPRFLYAALSFFSPQDMMALMESARCPVVVQRGRRVFPASEKASDVTKALLSLLRSAGAEIRLNTAVRSLETEGGRVAGVRTEDGKFLPADAVIVCTGGFSYPSTGSTGDGYRFAAEAGHTVSPPSPVLVGLETAEDWSRALQGLSLRRDFAASGKKQLQTELCSLLPSRLADLFPRLAGLPDRISCSQVTAEQRRRLADTLKALPLSVRAPRPVAEAVVTRGGVSVREVDPASMRSKLVENLYFAGELLDVDAHTGGFNLQIAWSTGALAGKSAAEAAESNE